MKITSFHLVDQPSTQVRPTQQVQPVSPVIEATSTESQPVTEQMAPVEPVASTSRTTPPPPAQPVVPSQSVAPSNKRQRDDTERYDLKRNYFHLNNADLIYSITYHHYVWGDEMKEVTYYISVKKLPK